MSPLFTQSTLLWAGTVLANASAPQLPTGLNSETQKAFSGSTVAFVAGLLVMGLGLIWAVFFRKSDKQKARGVITDAKSSGRRRRRRRSKDRPRNPTLADTGGLPPKGSGNLNPPEL
ncbi:MAG: hypothetical protein RIT19_590 [Verrucomicrobiota bacterium]|jgi:hypothetical protein